MGSNASCPAMAGTAVCPALDNDVAQHHHEKVMLNIYDIGTSCTGPLVNSVLRPMGAGAFHCGVEVFDREWSYADSKHGKDGVFSCPPCCCEGHTFYQSVFMGYVSFSRRFVMEIIKASKKDWLSVDYHVFYHNCCHYSSDLCQRLGVDPVPAWTTSLPHLVGACVNQDCCVASPVPPPKEGRKPMTSELDVNKLSPRGKYPNIGQLPANADYYDLWKAEFG